jgi:FkbM family methyltransferase
MDGIEAQINISNYGELRYVEGTTVEGYRDERIVLETLIQMLQPGDVAYDIGANIGIHTIFMAKKVAEEGKIVAFEPERNNYEALSKNLSLNRLNNVIPVKAALGDKVGSENLYIRKRIGSGAVSIIKNDDSSFCQEIETVPGDFIVQSKTLPLPKAVKIDVEGYEYPVIKGLQKTLSQNICRLVCCEIHPALLPAEVKPELLIELMKSLGFNQIRVHHRGSEIHAIFYKN